MPATRPPKPEQSVIYYLKRAHERLVHGHHAARVVELPAVVGRGEERH